MGIQQNWSTTPATNQTSDPNINWREGQGPSTVNDSARTVMARVKAYQLDTSGIAETAGTGTAYTLATNEVFTSLVDGMVVAFRPHVNGGAAPTLNVDGQGAVALQVKEGVAVPSGALRAGNVYRATYVDAEPAWVVTSGMSRLLVPESMTLTVGDGGDFATINQALEFASTLQPMYNAANPVGIVVHLLAGYTETQGVFVNNVDLFHILITSDDAIVPANVSGDLFHAEWGRLPRIQCVFDMDGSGGHGIWLAQAEVYVGIDGVPGSGGVINAGKSGLYSIAMGRFTILGGDFHGAQEFGAYINHASTGEIAASNFSQAGQRGGNSDELGTPFNGIHVRHSSRLNISTGTTDARLGGSTDSDDDIRVEYGGTIDLDENLFLGGISQAPNFVNENGIIFLT